MIRSAARAAAAGLVTAAAAPAAGQPPGPDAMVEVRRANETGAGARLLGFVADDAGHVVAQIVADDAGRVAGADFVARLADGAEYAARGVAYDAGSGLGLLRLTADPRPAPYRFARDPAESGRAVYGATVDADTGEVVVRRGAIGGIEPGAGSEPADPATIRHNALAGERRHGAPLFNNCGQVVGVIVDRAAAPPGSALAAPAEWLAATFGGAGLAPVRADEVCLSETERARAAVEESERRAEEAEQARAAAEEALRAVEEQVRGAAGDQAAAEEAERARAAAEEALRAAAEEAEARAAEAGRLRTAAEDRAAEAERGRQAAWRYAVWAVAAGGALSVLPLWLVARRSRARAARAGRAAAEEAAAARTAMAARDAADREAAAVPDVVLVGTGPDGGLISLRVPGRAVAGPSGAVVGRSPFDGEVVLNHPEVSRRHFRLFRADGALMVEDLGSMNGTALDGAPLVAGAGRPVAAGARLCVGQIEFTVRTPAADGGEGVAQ